MIDCAMNGRKLISNLVVDSDDSIVNIELKNGLCSSINLSFVEDGL